jgi:hypothetical protein
MVISEQSTPSTRRADMGPSLTKLAKEFLTERISRHFLADSSAPQITVS